jgi:hypothetical protein
LVSQIWIIILEGPLDELRRDKDSPLHEPLDSVESLLSTEAINVILIRMEASLDQPINDLPVVMVERSTDVVDMHFNQIGLVTPL